MGAFSKLRGPSSHRKDYSSLGSILLAIYGNYHSSGSIEIWLRHSLPQLHRNCEGKNHKSCWHLR